MRSLMENFGVSDLLLLDAGSGDVVYSVKKRIDVGTDATIGPWADGALGEVVEGLRSAALGDTVISDTTFYVPARGQAVIFVSTAVRSGSEVLGAVVAELPVQAITDLATADQDWELLGLGETGDIYVVGPDGTLRTDPRDWLDDSEAFLSDNFDRNRRRDADRTVPIGGLRCAHPGGRQPRHRCGARGRHLRGDGVELPR